VRVTKKEEEEEDSWVKHIALGNFVAGG